MDFERRIFVLLVGEPYSGKGFIARLLVTLFGFLHLSTSKLLKEHAPEYTDLINRGRLAPDEAIIRLMLEHMPKGSRIVIDSPRSSDQVKKLKLAYPEAELITLDLFVQGHVIKQRIDLAPQTERGEREDDSSIEDRQRIYEEYSVEMRQTLIDMTNFVRFDASPSREVVERKLVHVCRSLGIRSAETVAV